MNEEPYRVTGIHRNTIIYISICIHFTFNLNTDVNAALLLNKQTNVASSGSNMVMSIEAGRQSECIGKHFLHCIVSVRDTL